MTTPRETLTTAFGQVLESALGSHPEQLFVNVPIGKLADRALEVFGDVPKVPAFDPEITPNQTFTGALTRDDVAAQHTFSTVGVRPDTETYGVALAFADGRSHTEGSVVLPLKDAEAHALAILSTVAHQREQERQGL